MTPNKLLEHVIDMLDKSYHTQTRLYRTSKEMVVINIVVIRLDQTKEKFIYHSDKLFLRLNTGLQLEFADVFSVM